MATVWLSREAHVAKIAQTHGIDIEVASTSHRGVAYRRQPRHGIDQPFIRIPPIRGQVSYFLALHELGHILGHGSGLVRLEEEALAWRWALANAEEDPSLATLKAIRRRVESYFTRAYYRRRMTLPGEGSEFHSLLTWLVEVTS